MVYGIVDADPWKNAIVQIAQAKVNMSGWVVFLKGIGANWLVCLAVWLGFSAHSTAGKMMGLWFPVMCFVAIGYEHSIANMFFIPLGMLQGAVISWCDFILANLIPATFGNIVGGACLSAVFTVICTPSDKFIRLSTVQTVTEENLTTDIANILNERL